MRQLKINKNITNRSTISIDKYLQDISKIPLLNREEEEILCHRIVKEGRKQDIDRLVNANLRFVVSVAKQYHITGVELIDLINEGNMGLIQAVERFDPTKGFKFISYAVWWIRQAINNYFYQKARTIKIPQNKITQINKVDRVYQRLEQEFQYTPTVSQIYEEMGRDIEMEDITALLGFKDRIKSLDEPFTEHGDEGLIDYLAGENESHDISSMESEYLVKLAKTVLRPKEFIIFEMYYGFDDGKVKNMEQVAKKVDMTRERVRQILIVIHRRLSTPKMKRLITKAIL